MARGVSLALDALIENLEKGLPKRLHLLLENLFHLHPGRECILQ
ncbi:hypothetical protein C2W63_03265 [Bacillus velezensis]|nr:hypothetical protein C2W63_03265 [Bacillus velezensis]